MNPEKSKTAAFTGHRSFKKRGGDLFSYDPAPGETENLLNTTLRELCRQGYVRFLCGMAEGFDLMAGEAVVSLRGEFPQIRLVAVQPFPDQAARFGGAVRERYDKLMAAADSVITVSPGYRPECYHLRNDYLVANSSTLVCFFNGSPGGTAYTVKQALRAGLHIINLCR